MVDKTYQNGLLAHRRWGRRNVRGTNGQARWRRKRGRLNQDVPEREDIVVYRFGTGSMFGMSLTTSLWQALFVSVLKRRKEADQAFEFREWGVVGRKGGLRHVGKLMVEQIVHGFLVGITQRLVMGRCGNRHRRSLLYGR